MSWPISPLSRRRFIRISAAAAGLALVPIGRASRAGASLVAWHGTALGAEATMQIHHPDRDEAQRLIARSLTEVRRLERLFSLYQDDSALVELNRTGVMVSPAPELVELLELSARYAELTRGAFDPTVQPLWELYAKHFLRSGADPTGPSESAVRAVVACVGYRKLLVSGDRIAMPNGTAVTLNGIAQGYITDKVVDLLRARGIEHSLVDMGETRVIGTRPDGLSWDVGIADPDEPTRIAAMLPLVDRAVATSGAYGFRFDPTGRFNHLFNPATGACACLYRSVTTVADRATAADALSTAFSLMPRDRIQSVMRSVGIQMVYLIDADGTPSRLEA
jgi:thiamine biosynthesis lipoprotein